MKKQKILIADDTELNRALLIDILSEQFDILEARDGVEAVEIMQEHSEEISLLLLDIMMPRMDGFEVLGVMNKYRWIDYVPVIIISSENTPADIERAYKFGVTDFIPRPFDASIVYHRVSNAILLAAKQRHLMEIAADQIYEKNKNSRLMISILSHIVEFRNGESGLHVLHVNAITEMLLRRLMQKTDKYSLTRKEIDLISIASAIHDIGKISISDTILNKPGRLTDEEFEIMKTHSRIGADMLNELSESQKNEPLVRVAYEICRWHHERWDGSGYPDGLKGDEIPISAQIVSLADVYDALTSERCYKKAFSHDRALEMILSGQCGAFNPLLLECLEEIGDTLKKEIKVGSYTETENRDLKNIAKQLREYDLSASEHLFEKLEFEHQKFQFLAASESEVVFWYTTVPPLLHFNKYGAELLGVGETIAEPLADSGFIGSILKKIEETTPESPAISTYLQIPVGGVSRKFHCAAQTLWTTECVGVIGKLIAE